MLERGRGRSSKIKKYRSECKYVLVLFKNLTNIMCGTENEVIIFFFCEEQNFVFNCLILY